MKRKSNSQQKAKANAMALLGAMARTHLHGIDDFAEVFCAMLDATVEHCDDRFTQYDLMSVIFVWLQTYLEVDKHIAVAEMLGPVLDAMDALPVERYWPRRDTPELATRSN